MLPGGERRCSLSERPPCGSPQSTQARPGPAREIRHGIGASSGGAGFGSRESFTRHRERRSGRAHDSSQVAGQPVSPLKHAPAHLTLIAIRIVVRCATGAMLAGKVDCRAFGVTATSRGADAATRGRGPTSHHKDCRREGEWRTAATPVARQSGAPPKCVCVCVWKLHT